MAETNDWRLKGIMYECCRMEGQCPLGVGRDIRSGPCEDIQAYDVQEGHIGDVDMKGIKLILFQDGISGNFSEMAIKRGAWYVSDNATEEQRTILESFLPKQLGAARWGEYLGIRFVKIDISEQDNIYHITMPYAEMKVRLLMGRDGKNPITLENAPARMSITRFRISDGIMWTYHDYGIDVEWEKTSSAMLDFNYKG